MQYRKGVQYTRIVNPGCFWVVGIEVWNCACLRPFDGPDEAAFKHIVSVGVPAERAKDVGMKFIYFVGAFADNLPCISKLPAFRYIQFLARRKKGHSNN